MGGSQKTKIGSGEVGRFDQRNTMFSRPRDTERSDPELLALGKKHYGVRDFTDRQGYSHKDYALAMGAWYMERWWGFGNIVGDKALYEWEPDQSTIETKDRLRPGTTWPVDDAQEMSGFMKKAAVFLGASDAGICRVDPRWIYSHRFDPSSMDHEPIEGGPQQLKHAIVMVHEMDYQLMRTSPTYGEYAATGKGYSMMAQAASSVAHFIRDLGYRAIPTGNDTALSVPMAIDAGLGELGRNGLLISPKFGPRVRISKVFTDMPLIPDTPIELGVRAMCEVCGKCAESCPGQAISRDEPTWEGPSISNNHGLYKWYLNADRCFGFWCKNKGSCGNCIRVCVFNKPDTKFHAFVRAHVKHLPQFDKLYLWADDLFGYGKQIKPQDVWK